MNDRIVVGFTYSNPFVQLPKGHELANDAAFLLKSARQASEKVGLGFNCNLDAQRFEEGDLDDLQLQSQENINNG